MTDERQINDALGRIFKEEGVRIVFWNDPNKEFLDYMDRLPFLTIGDTTVNIIKLDQVGALEVKLRLEKDDPKGRYLLYSPAEEPDYENDWLLDIRSAVVFERIDLPLFWTSLVSRITTCASIWQTVGSFSIIRTDSKSLNSWLEPRIRRMTWTLKWPL